MAGNRNLYKTVRILIATVWAVNGALCKVVNLVPRHQHIVARILGSENASFFTKAIGILEVCMAVWIVSAVKPRMCAVIQIIVVAAMNSLEFFLVPDLLLFGKWNAFFAFLFILVIWYNELARNKIQVSK